WRACPDMARASRYAGVLFLTVGAEVCRALVDLVPHQCFSTAGAQWPLGVPIRGCAAGATIDVHAVDTGRQRRDLYHMLYCFRTRRTRRDMVPLLGGTMLGMLTPTSALPVLPDACAALPQARPDFSGNVDAITMFMCGDVMVGRGIDQVLPHPSDPRLYEPSVQTALGYVALAVTAHGPIPAPVDFAYIW